MKDRYVVRDENGREVAHAPDEQAAHAIKDALETDTLSRHEVAWKGTER